MPMPVLRGLLALAAIDAIFAGILAKITAKIGRNVG
jgi:hypothetical protein